jgi:hypothetical protein
VRREAIALLTASLLHVALFSLERLAPQEAARSQPGQPANELEIEMMPEEEQAPLTEAHGRQEDAETTTQLPKAPEVSRRETAPAAPQGNQLDGSQRVEALSLAGQQEEPAQAAGSRDSAPADTAGPINLGIGADGWKRWIRETQPTEAPPRSTSSRRRAIVHVPPVSSTGGLQEGLEQRDRELGLSPSGRVISALYQAALAESPRIGYALFAVTVSRAGSVDVALVHSEGGGPDWQSVGRRAAQSLREKLPRIPSARNGVRVVLKVVTEEVLPGGKREGLSALLPLLGDPANIGAKPQKMIRTRLQEETMF